MELSDFVPELKADWNETSFRVNNTKIGNFTKSKGKLILRVSRGFSTMGNPLELSDFVSDLHGNEFSCQ